MFINIFSFTTNIIKKYLKTIQWYSNSVFIEMKYQNYSDGTREEIKKQKDDKEKIQWNENKNPWLI